MFTKRFTSKYVVDNNNCWIWQAGKRDGYGRYHHNGKWEQAHRYAYIVKFGMIPNDLQLDHTCRNRACVNPDHVEPVTQKENIERGNSPFILNKVKTQCKNGHIFTEDNTSIDKHGYRKCKTCHNNRSLNHYYKKKLGQTGLHNKHKTHCVNGHIYDNKNTKVNKDGCRICRTCYKNSLKHKGK